MGPKQGKTTLIGFGPNYYLNMGGARRRLLVDRSQSGLTEADTAMSVSEQGGLSEISGHGDGVVRSESEFPAQSSGPLQVSAYVFSSTDDATESKDEYETPPWDKENDPVVQVACGAASSMFLTESGKVYSSGTVHGRIRASPTRTVIQLPLKCVEIAAGRHFCLARVEGGLAVLSWGAGHFGQLGLGDAHPLVEQPVVIEGLLPHVTGSPISSITAGYWHAAAVNEAGQVWAWGCNRNYQCGRKRNGDAAAPSQSSSNSPPPTIMVPQRVPNLGQNTRVVKVAAGRAHSVALDSKGAVYCWGSSSYGQCGGSITSKRKCGVAPPRQVEALQKVTIVDIAAGEMHTLALTGGGRVFSWGGSVEGQLGLGFCNQANVRPKLVGDLDFVAIEASREWKHEQKSKSIDTSQSKSDDTSGAGQLGPSRHSALSQVAKIVSIDACSNYSVAVSSSGHVYTWGCNDVGTLGIARPTTSTLTLLDPTDLDNASLRSKSVRFKEFQTFDSSHNLGLPTRVDCLSDYHIQSCALGPTHLWFVGEERNSPSNAALTLYELQQRRKQLKTSPHHYKAQTSTDDDMSAANTSTATNNTDTGRKVEGGAGTSGIDSSNKPLETIEDMECNPDLSPTSESLTWSRSKNGGGQCGDMDSSAAVNTATTAVDEVSPPTTSPVPTRRDGTFGDSSEHSNSDVALTQATSNSLSLASPGSKSKKFRPMKLIKKLGSRRSSGNFGPSSPGVSSNGEPSDNKKLRRFFGS